MLSRYELRGPRWTNLTMLPLKNLKVLARVLGVGSTSRRPQLGPTSWCRLVPQWVRVEGAPPSFEAFGSRLIIRLGLRHPGLRYGRPPPPWWAPPYQRRTGLESARATAIMLSENSFGLGTNICGRRSAYTSNVPAGLMASPRYIVLPRLPAPPTRTQFQLKQRDAGTPKMDKGQELDYRPFVGTTAIARAAHPGKCTGDRDPQLHRGG